MYALNITPMGIKMSIQKLVEEYNQTATAPYVKLTPEIAQFLAKLASDNGAPNDLELLANHTLAQAKMHHAIYEQRVLERLASEETGAAPAYKSTPAPEPTMAKQEEPALTAEQNTGNPELDAFLKEIEKLGGTVVSAIGGTAPKGFGLTLLATLFDGVDKSATISDIISKFKSPCHSCGKFH